MKKFILLALLMVGFVSTVRAESSATAYDSKTASQQVFVVSYNNGGNTISRDQVVILDIGGGTAGTTLGQYITQTQVSDSIWVFGVADESILAGSLGRICVRGPHKVVMNSSQAQATGQIIGASGSFGKAGWYSTADGTAGGQLGWIISSAATSDTGDATGTFWAWVSPRIHK